MKLGEVNEWIFAAGHAPFHPHVAISVHQSCFVEHWRYEHLFALVPLYVLTLCVSVLSTEGPQTEKKPPVFTEEMLPWFFIVGRSFPLSKVTLCRCFCLSNLMVLVVSCEVRTSCSDFNTVVCSFRCPLQQKMGWEDLGTQAERRHTKRYSGVTYSYSSLDVLLYELIWTCCFYFFWKFAG